MKTLWRKDFSQNRNFLFNCARWFMYCLREALLIRLRWEGNTVKVEHRNSDNGLKLLLTQTRDDLRQVNAEALVAADVLTYAEVLALEQKERLTPEEQLQIAKFHLLDFYDLETLAVEDCLWDRDGRRRGELLSLEALLHPQAALERSARALEKQASWHQGFTPWDFAQAPLRSALQKQIGLDTFLAEVLTGKLISKDEYKPYADRARALALQVKVALHFTIKAEMSDVQVINQLLSQMGIKLRRTMTVSLPVSQGKQVHCYRLNQEAWSQTEAILARRQAKRERLAALAATKDSAIHPSDDDQLNEGGELTENPDAWLSAANLAAVKALWSTAGDDDVVRAAVRAVIPGYVLQHLGLTA